MGFQLEEERGTGRSAPEIRQSRRWHANEKWAALEKVQKKKKVIMVLSAGYCPSGGLVVMAMS